MSSWFSSIASNVASLEISSVVAKAVSDAVDVVSNIDSDSILEKLTLTTPELLAEKHRIDMEEKRKARLKDALAKHLPWETADEDRRDILVEECKEAILQLSRHKETFYGPYQLPPLKAKLVEDDEDGGEEDTSDDEEFEEDHEDGEDDNLVEDEKRNSLNPPTAAPMAEPTTSTASIEASTGAGSSARGENAEDETTVDTIKGTRRNNRSLRVKDIPPSQESIERLQALEPLPALLQHFDFEMHVGLIQRMLAVDERLVKMQSKYSGGGIREIVFWKNYFIHCAYTRYVAGLSIDELWAAEALENNNSSQNAFASASNDSDDANTASAPHETELSKKADSATDHETTATEAHVAGALVPGASSSLSLKPTSEDRQQKQGMLHSSSLSEFEVLDKDDKSNSATNPNTFTDGDTTRTFNHVGSTPSGSTAGTSSAMNNHNGQMDMGNLDSNNMDDDDCLVQVDDYELDELEAEIARELED